MKTQSYSGGIEAGDQISQNPRLTGKIIVLLAGLSAISTLSTNIILPAFPEIAEQLGISARELGLTLSSFFITFALAQLVVGPLADRYGRKKLILVGLSIFIVGTVVGGLAGSLDTLIIGRVIQALGVCAAAVLARAIARDLFDGETLARALSLTMIATAAAPGFSPLVGSVLTTTLGWRAIFILVGLAAFAVGIFYTATLGETHPNERRAPVSIPGVIVAYFRLAVNGQFILPALSVSLLMSGCLLRCRTRNPDKGNRVIIITSRFLLCCHRVCGLRRGYGGSTTGAPLWRANHYLGRYPYSVTRWWHVVDWA